jgi:hypothetical protein
VSREALPCAPLSAWEIASRLRERNRPLPDSEGDPPKRQKAAEGLDGDTSRRARKMSPSASGTSGGMERRPEGPSARARLLRGSTSAHSARQ